MTCDKSLELISAHLDGELTAQEEAALSAHLKECPACRELSEQLQQLRTAFDCVDEVDAPSDLSKTVMGKINAERQASRRRLIRRISGFAACLVLCVGVFRIVDAVESEHNRNEVDPDLPSMARLMEPQPVALNRLDAYSLPVSDTAVEPLACLLNSEEGLERFLGQLPATDLSEEMALYDAEFFRTNRLLAVVLQEPSSSITHRVIELTEDRVVILRDVPEAGDSDMARWLVLAQMEGTGAEATLVVELRTN